MRSSGYVQGSPLRPLFPFLVCLFASHQDPDGQMHISTSLEVEDKLGTCLHMLDPTSDGRLTEQGQDDRKR